MLTLKNNTLSTLKTIDKMVDSVCFESIGRAVCGAVIGSVINRACELAGKKLAKVESDRAKFASIGLTDRESDRTVDLIHHIWESSNEDNMVVFIDSLPYRDTSISGFAPGESLTAENFDSYLLSEFESHYADYYVGKVLLVLGKKATTYRVSYYGTKESLTLNKWGSVNLW